MTTSEGLQSDFPVGGKVDGATRGSPWLTGRQAAVYVHLSEATLRREAKSGRLRAFKVGGRRVWRYRIDDLDSWLLQTNTPVEMTASPLSQESRKARCEKVG